MAAGRISAGTVNIPDLLKGSHFNPSGRRRTAFRRDDSCRHPEGLNVFYFVGRFIAAQLKPGSGLLSRVFVFALGYVLTP